MCAKPLMRQSLSERIGGKGQRDTEDEVFAVTPGRSVAGKKDGEGINSNLQQSAASLGTKIQNARYGASGVLQA